MGKKYLDTKESSLESSILGVWETAIGEREEGFDGRTSKYKSHRSKLEAARVRRENKKLKKEDVDLGEVFNGTKQDIRKITRATDNALKKRLSQIQKMLRSKTNEKGKGLTDFEFDHISDEGDAINAELVYRKKRGGKGKDPTTDDIPPHLKKFVNEDVDLDEGTWALPKTSKQKAALKKLMAKPLPVGDMDKMGPDDITNKLGNLIGDDELFDDLYDLYKKKGKRADALPLLKKAMKRLTGYDTVREDVDLDEGTKEEYQKFFNAAMKKFKIDSPADLKSDEEKKKFFDYVDKNYKGEKDEAFHAFVKEQLAKLKEELDLTEGRMSDLHLLIKQGKSAEEIAKIMKVDVKTIKALMAGYKESFEIGTEKYLKHTTSVTPGQKEWTETVTKKANSMRETLAKMWKVGEGKNVFAKETKKSLTNDAKKGKTMTGKKISPVDTSPSIKEKR